MTMKVYTKRGDSGKTDLIGGERVAKNSPNVEAYGTVDELMACVGVLIACGESEGFRGQLQWIQNRLMECASILAIGKDPRGVASKVPRIVESHVRQLESWIDEYESRLPPLKAFSAVACGAHGLPSRGATYARCGGNPSGGACVYQSPERLFFCLWAYTGAGK